MKITLITQYYKSEMGVPQEFILIFEHEVTEKNWTGRCN